MLWRGVGGTVNGYGYLTPGTCSILPF
jgi:hypothetical protein